MQAPWQVDSLRGRELLRLVAMSTNDGIWDWDLETQQVFYSSRWLELVGLSPEESSDDIDLFFRLVHPDDAARVQASIGAYLKEDAQDYRIEFRLRYKDGTWRWISSRGIALRDDKGHAYRIAGTHTDITERVLAAERLEQLVVERTADLRASRDRAEIAASAVAKFLAATSHDVRQPLQAMALLLGALESDVLSDSGKRSVIAIKRSLLASMELLDHLLEYSRIGAGALRPTMVAVQLGELIEAVVSGFYAEADSRGVQLRVVPTTLVGRSDPQLLGRILRNLVANALKYTQKGRVLIGCRCQGDEIRVEVWDTGSGIEPDMQRQVFWEFVQVRAADSIGGGLGLGLTIVERLARILAHKIDVKSTVGKGSTFSVTLPRSDHTEAVPASAMPTASPSWQGGSLRVAFIEDNPEITGALRQLFAKWGWQLIEATSLDDLLAKVGPKPPDLLLVDWHINGKHDGFAVYDALEKTYGFRIPGAVLTGDWDFENLKRANTSLRRVLHKPILPTVLYAVLQSELHLARRASDE